jgi:hypothetical protein
MRFAIYRKARAVCTGPEKVDKVVRHPSRLGSSTNLLLILILIIIIVVQPVTNASEIQTNSDQLRKIVMTLRCIDVKNMTNQNTELR